MKIWVYTKEQKTINSARRVKLQFGIKELGEMLGIPYRGNILDAIEVEDDKFKWMIINPNSKPTLNYKPLTPLGKIITNPIM